MQLADQRFYHYLDVPFWRRAAVRVAAALSATMLVLGILLPEPFAGPLLGLGLAGILTLRLLVIGAVRGSRGGVGTRGARNVAAARAGESSDAHPPGAAAVWRPAALAGDASNDSVPVGDPPSWTTLRPWPRSAAPQAAGSVA